MFSINLCSGTLGEIHTLTEGKTEIPPWNMSRFPKVLYSLGVCCLHIILSSLHPTTAIPVGIGQLWVCAFLQGDTWTWLCCAGLLSWVFLQLLHRGGYVMLQQHGETGTARWGQWQWDGALNSMRKVSSLSLWQLKERSSLMGITQIRG